MPGQEPQQWQYPNYDYSSYYAAWQNYQSQNPYYAYDQNYANYAGGYQYPAAAAAQYASYQQEYAESTEKDESEAAAAAAAPQADVQAASAQQYYDYSATYEATENVIEEHDVPLNKDRLNEETMTRNNDLFDAIEESRWLPLHALDPPHGK